jgi:hypothetical protein
MNMMINDVIWTWAWLKCVDLMQQLANRNCRRLVNNFFLYLEEKY